MRYDSKNKRIEMASYELSSGRGHIYEESYIDDIAIDITSGFPCDIYLSTTVEDIEFFISGHVSSVYGSHDYPTIVEVILESDIIHNIRAPQPSSHICCLAYMMCKTSGIDTINIETIVYDPLKDQNIREIRAKNFDQLEKHFLKLIYNNIPNASMLIERSNMILHGASTVKFPFSHLREGQETMMRRCYEAMINKERLFVQAPTGTGKTISTLYSAVKFLGNGHCDKIFYLTAKNSTQKEAYKAAGKLFECGAHLRTLILSSKEVSCINTNKSKSEFLCSHLKCKYSRHNRKMYDAAINDLLTKQNGYDRDTIVKAAKRFEVCPYELSLLLSEYCEIIISDYNYVFDPMVCLDRYFGNVAEKSKYVFLVDEAHNLSDRTRAMYSAEVSLSYLKRIYLHIDKNNSALAKRLYDAVLYLERDMRRLCLIDMQRDSAGIEHGFYTNRHLPNELKIKMRLLCDEVEKKVKHLESSDDILLLQELKKNLSRFYVLSNKYFDERYLFYCEVNGDDVILKIFCLDPSRILEKIHAKAESSIMFSATLTPLDYFADILGGGKKSVTLSLASPFDRNNLLIAACEGISTRYEDRQQTLKQVVSYIAATVSGKKGNYLVYFPSYAYMNRAVEIFTKKYSKVRTIVQKPGMKRKDVEDFINEFINEDGKMRIGFCVLGGNFSEGIDLPGKSLIGVVIVGAGIPGISSERNIMRDYYELSRGCGYDYSYTYPGMNNVLQAAGRVIRGDTDRGVVVLVDDRYSTAKYREMYPDHWDKMQHFDSASSLNSAIMEFWKQNAAENASPLK